MSRKIRSAPSDRGGAQAGRRSRGEQLVLRLGEVAEEDLLEAWLGQLIELDRAHQASVADDPDAVADVLDFGQDVRGQENRRAFVAGLAQQRVELLPVERVETTRRL